MMNFVHRFFFLKKFSSMITKSSLSTAFYFSIIRQFYLFKVIFVGQCGIITQIYTGKTICVFLARYPIKKILILMVFYVIVLCVSIHGFLIPLLFIMSPFYLAGIFYNSFLLTHCKTIKSAHLYNDTLSLIENIPHEHPVFTKHALEEE